MGIATVNQVEPPELEAVELEAVDRAAVELEVVESDAKTTRRLASDLRRQLQEGWPTRIRVHLVAATVQRTLDLRGRGAVLQVYEGGELDLQLTADLREALRRCPGARRLGSGIARMPRVRT